MTLEQNIGQAVKKCKKHGLSRKGKYDIALWDGESLTSVIEVKRSFQYGQGPREEDQDVVRICTTLKAMAALGKKTTFATGYLRFWCRAKMMYRGILSAILRRELRQYGMVFREEWGALKTCA